jgi:lipoic acid synthetase
MRSSEKILRKPKWIRSGIPYGENFKATDNVIKKRNLNTVCRHAACPNISQCWEKKHATFMILGDTCTRNCRFCNVKSVKNIKPVDNLEPYRLGLAVKELCLEYVVLTSVTRDDLPDFGMGFFLESVKNIKKQCPDTLIELLIPDFQAVFSHVEKIAGCGVQVAGHNLELVPGLYGIMRPEADYSKSLKVLKMLKNSNPDLMVKTALIIGLGEGKKELYEVFGHIADCKVDMLYIGQYLRPSLKHAEVKKYYSLEEFEKLKEQAKKQGIKFVLSGPMVRSSYKAKESYMQALKNFKMQGVQNV